MSEMYTQKYVSVSVEEVRCAAMLLYEYYAEYESDYKWSECAKNGQLVDFTQKINLQRVRRIEEAASADHMAEAK